MEEVYFELLPEQAGRRAKKRFYRCQSRRPFPDFGHKRVKNKINPSLRDNCIFIASYKYGLCRILTIKAAPRYSEGC